MSPTKAIPGSEAKIRIMEERFRHNLPLFHDDDLHVQFDPVEHTRTEKGRIIMRGVVGPSKHDWERFETLCDMAVEL